MRDRRISAVIFDMDGTLLDTMPYWRYTSLEYLLAHDIPFTNEDLLRMHDLSSRKLLADILRRELGTEPDMAAIIPELEAYMDRHYRYDARLKPDVEPMLRLLKQRGLKLCVATGSPREYARHGLGRLGILDYFEFVTDNYEFGIRKGAPGYFELVAERLGVPVSQCLVAEDALYSIEAARLAGCATLGIEDGTAILQREDIVRLSDVYIRGWAETLEDPDAYFGYRKR